MRERNYTALLNAPCLTLPFHPLLIVFALAAAAAMQSIAALSRLRRCNERSAQADASSHQRGWLECAASACISFAVVPFLLVCVVGGWAGWAQGDSGAREKNKSESRKVNGRQSNRQQRRGSDESAEESFYRFSSALRCTRVSGGSVTALLRRIVRLRLNSPAAALDSLALCRCHW